MTTHNSNNNDNKKKKPKIKESLRHQATIYDLPPHLNGK